MIANRKRARDGNADGWASRPDLGTEQWQNRPPSTFAGTLWADTFLDGTRKKCAILPNEPTDFAMKNRGYLSGEQGVTMAICERKRWVRFRKRPHREGVN